MVTGVVTAPANVSCNDTGLVPASVNVNNGVFTVTCDTTNASMVKVSVKKPDGTYEDIVVPNNQLGISYDPDQVGTYEFTCIAWSPSGDVLCDTETGTVYTTGTNDKVDPAIEIFASDNNTYTCGETVYYTAVVSNTYLANQEAEFTTTIKVPF